MSLTLPPPFIPGSTISKTSSNEFAREALDHPNEFAREALDHPNEFAREALDHPNMKGRSCT